MTITCTYMYKHWYWYSGYMVLALVYVCHEQYTKDNFDKNSNSRSSSDPTHYEGEGVDVWNVTCEAKAQKMVWVL